MSKMKIAMIAAIAMASIASPVLAQTAQSQDRTYRSERFYDQTPSNQGNYDWNNQQSQGGSDY
jgi:hypothetical protein